MEKYPEPIINIEMGDDVWEMKPHNSEVVKYIGRYAIYDHIYHESDDEETCMYIFSGNEHFNEIVDAMIEMQFPFHLWMPFVEEAVERAYTNMRINEMEEDWDES